MSVDYSDIGKRIKTSRNEKGISHHLTGLSPCQKGDVNSHSEVSEGTLYGIPNLTTKKLPA